MDLFIDKLAQKISSTEMMKANSAVDTKETDKLKEKVEGYEKLLQEMKLINMKNLESAEKLNSLAGECREAAMAAAEATKAAMEAAEAGKNNEEAKEDEDIFAKTSDVIHKENVKVYRNIQASMQSSLDDQTKAIIDSQEQSSKKNSVGFLKIMSVLIFIAVLADIALKVLTLLGIL